MARALSALAAVRRRLRQEDGLALPVAVIILGLVLTLGGVAVYQAASASDGTIRDTEVKRAVQAADAGLEVALGRMAITWEPPCTLSEPGWCPPVEEALGDGESYSYTIYDDLDPETPHRVVSTGLAAEQTRRVTLEVHPPTPDLPAFGQYAVRSLNDLTLNSNTEIGSPEIAGHAASNGNITLDSNSMICGNATPGPGHQVVLRSNADICEGYSTAPATEPFTLPLPPLPTQFDNARICATGGDPCTPSADVSWDSTTRRLSLNSNSVVTLGGSVYGLCQLRLDSNSQLRVATGATVQIYFLPASQCGSVTESIRLDSNSRIVNSSGDPTRLQVYVMGSGAVNFNSNFQNSNLPMLLYAPNSTVSFNSNVNIVGSVAANRVSLDSNASIQYDSRSTSVVIPGTGSDLERLQFVECTTEPVDPEDPGSGC